MAKPILDKDFSNLMKKSKLELPFSDFEENVMTRIHEESRIRATSSKSIKLSTIFFLLGTGFGLVVQTILTNSDNSVLGIQSQNFLLIFQTLYVVIVLTQLEAIIKLIAGLKR